MSVLLLMISWLMHAPVVHGDATQTPPSNHYKATVTVDTTFTKNPISKLIYGNNIKWLFNGESRFNHDNGVWSSQHNSINPNALNFLRESGVTALRYGDGTNVDFFYWGWSILPMEARLQNNVLNRWGKNENYVFGIIEFLKLCKEIKCEPSVIINYRMELLTSFYDPDKHQDKRTKFEIAVQQAANLVEFLNAPTHPQTTESYPAEYLPEFSLQKMPRGYFAYLRAQMGFIEPIGIKYWEIGNETNAFHESGAQARKKGIEVLEPIPCRYYTSNAITFARKMKAVDPAIKIGIVEYPDDLKKQLDSASKEQDAIDFLIAHDYVKGSSDGNLGTYTFYGSGRKSGLHREITIETGGDYSLTISAWGRAYFGKKYPSQNGVAPNLEVSINGKPVGELSIKKNINLKNERISRKFESYSHQITLKPGPNTIDLRLGNDFLDRTSFDLDHRGRDIFVNSIHLEGPNTDKELLWEFPSEPLYAQLASVSDAMHKRNIFIKKYAPHLFIAQTESAVYPNSGELGAAITEACMLFLAMDNSIVIRNFWHLFGSCDRMAAIHSGTKEKNNYHITPQYLVLKLFSNLFGDRLIDCSVESPILATTAMVRSDTAMPASQKSEQILSLQSRASIENGRLTVALVNLDPHKHAIVNVVLQNFSPSKSTMHTVSTKSENGPQATNEIIFDNVIINTIQIDPPFKMITLPPASISIIEYM